MNQDRRLAIRRYVSLPSQLLETGQQTSIEDVLMQILGDRWPLYSAALEIEGELKAAFDAQNETQRESPAKTGISSYQSLIQDRENSRTLELINSKLDLLLQRAVYPTPRRSYDLCLSSEGCSLRVDNVPEPGTCVSLHIVLPTNQHVVCKGRVQQQTPVCRIIFDEFASGTERALTRYLLMPESDQLQATD